MQKNPITSCKIYLRQTRAQILSRATGAAEGSGTEHCIVSATAVTELILKKKLAFKFDHDSIKIKLSKNCHRH